MSDLFSTFTSILYTVHINNIETLFLNSVFHKTQPITGQSGENQLQHRAKQPVTS